MLVSEKISRISGVISVPGDKSISHRAVMLAAISKGKTIVEGFLNGQDCLRTIDCFRAMGIQIDQQGQTVVIEGKGLRGLREPQDILDAGNSGTTIRLLTGILAGQNFHSIITGDQSLRQRPMARIATPLRQMGALIDGRQNDQFAPLSIRSWGLKGIAYTMPIASAQVKSAILLAGLYASSQTTVHEPTGSRDHTERMLTSFGIQVETKGTAVTVRPGSLEGQHVKVPGDISSAAFFMVAAAAMPGSHLTIRNVGLNPTRTGIIDVLRQMGAVIAIENLHTESGEEVGDIIVQGARLQGTSIGSEMIPRLIDEIPILAVAAVLADGVTYIRGAEELKVKESNRLAAIVSEMQKMGASITELPDGLEIRGPNKIRGAMINSYHDHRIAMAMAICGLFAEGKTRIADSACIDISFPGFRDLLRQVAR